MLNTVPTVAAGRQPRAVVRVNGAPMPGWVSWEVTANTYYEADTFRVSFATSAMADQTAPAWGALDKSLGRKLKAADWFSQQAEIYVEILAGFPSNPADPSANELSSLIYGRVDDIEFDPVSTMLSLTGRDLTAVFIDTRVAGEWSNQTSSGIATMLAKNHALTPKITATSTPVGVFYQHDQVRLRANQSEWDLLAWLAREEGFVCYVAGQELHFEPDAKESAEPYVLQWQAGPVANIEQMSFSRSLTVAKGVTVTVRSASLGGKVPVVESYPSHAKVVQAGKASPFGNTQNYYFTLPAGSTAVRCQQYAQARYREIIAHEMRMRARLPADNLLQAKSVIKVQGTGTAFDQTYYPMSITRMMSMDEGYTMLVDAKNRNPDSPLQ